ncbi:MAG: ribonuclease HI [Clostridia bacterium]|nr:ribonuclease HI [Clostridia bacterium]
MMKVTIYTDGACSGNPGPGGYAAIIMCGDNKKEIFGAERNTTNNRMELRAAIEGLKVLTKPCEVTLYSDSAYLVNAYLNKWVEGWKKNGWKNASKEPVKNVDLWEEIERLKEIHVVNFVKVKGHADNEYNNRCDELAVAAIKNIDELESVEEKVEEIAEREDLVYKAFKDLPELETERLKLRLFKDTDVDALYEACSDEKVTRFLSFDTYTSMDDAYNRIEFLKEEYEKLIEPPVWAITLKGENKAIGSINYLHVKEKHSVAEIGYWLASKYWNKGIMTEAVKGVLKFGFENMGLNKVIIQCDARNTGSYRVMEKCGLVYEGTLRQERFSKGEFVDIKTYSMLKEEYSSK